MRCKETRQLLSAYADQELALPEIVEIDKHLQACAACQQELGEQKARTTALKKHASYFVAPKYFENRLIAALAIKDVPKGRWAGRLREWFGQWPWRAPAAAFASAMALAWIIGVFVLLPSANDLLAEEVVSGYVRSLMVDHPANLVSPDRQAAKPSFAGKLDFSLKVSDFAAQGFPLIGSRVDYLDHRPVAVLMYRHAHHPINVYIWPASNAQEVPAQALSRQGYQLAHCVKGGMVYWAVSEVDPRQLMQLVAILQTEVRPYTGSLSRPVIAA
jgi:anti-sigma factor RsiW